LQSRVLPRALRGATTRRLGAAYKQLNAPFGRFGMNMLAASTKAIRGDDAAYASLESRIEALTTRRDALAHSIRGALDRAAFRGKAIKARQARRWVAQAQALLRQAAALAGS
jgi:hypothetical protein